MQPLPPINTKSMESSAPQSLQKASFSFSMNEQIQAYVQRGAASIDRIRSSLSDARLTAVEAISFPQQQLSPHLEPAIVSEYRTSKSAAALKSNKIQYNPPPAPHEAPCQAFIRTSKSAADDTSYDVGRARHSSDGDACGSMVTIPSVKAEISVDARNMHLPGAIQNYNLNTTPQRFESITDRQQSTHESVPSPSGSCESSPANGSPIENQQESAMQVPASPTKCEIPNFTDEQDSSFQAAVLYLLLTVQGFSFSIGSHSRFCKPALRVLMSVKYIALLVAIISVYSGVPWLGKYQDVKATALYPWWAVYLDKSAIVAIESMCVTFLFFDLALNMFAQGMRTYYREHLVANVSYTLILIWYLFDLINSVHNPESRSWSQGLRPIAMVRSVPKLEQVVSVFVSTLMKSLKLTFFAATFLLIIGCLSVVVTRYACDKMSIAEYCANLRKNWGSLDVSMLASFVIITSSGYARLFEDFLTILFSSSKGDKTGALNFSMVLLMCAIVFGGALGLTALYTASVFDSFKKARAQQYLKQLGMENRYLVESYIAACSAFDADEVDGLSEMQIRMIIQAVMPRLRGHTPMLSLIFRLIDVDRGGTVNVIEYCRLCGIVMLNFQIIHEGAPEDIGASGVVDLSLYKKTVEERDKVIGLSYLGWLHHVTDPGLVFQNVKHAVLRAWEELLESHSNVQRAAQFLRRFCASRFARSSVFLLLWSHLVLVVINAQMPPFKQDIVFEQQGISNNTVTYKYRQNLNDTFDVFILVTSIYVVIVLWMQYAFSIAKINTAMLFIPAELFFVFADFGNLVDDGFCLDCIWYARILRSVRAPVIALSLEPFVPLMKAISQLVSTLAVYIAFFYIVLNLFTNLGHLAFRDLGFMHKGVPALSFSTLQQTLTITIELSTADDWDEIRYDLYTVSNQRIYDVFFVFFYIVFNLCTTNVVTSLAIECFEYLHEKEANDDSSEGKHQQQAFDTDMHMKKDESYEMMLAPNGIEEIWTGKNEKHKFEETNSTPSIFREDKACCICNKKVGGTVLECSLCHLAVHFECWQRMETSSAAWFNSSEIQKFGKISFLHANHVPTCISKLRFNALRSHFSVYVKKNVNLLDLLILGPQLQTQAPNYESLIEILSEAGQDQRLIMFIEGLMFRQIAMDGEVDASASALHQSSHMWQNLYQCLQSGVVFVKRRHSAPNFKLPTNSGTSTPKNTRPSFSRKNSSIHKLQTSRPMIDLHKLARRSSWSMGIGTEDIMTSRRSSVEALDERSIFAVSSRRGSIADGQYGGPGTVVASGENQEKSTINIPSQHQRLQRRRGSISSSP